ncbi:MAG: hypothetical protein KGJ79_10735 [Alphaproteobacteria bacterium]|nr:hypothetical protein [Alphaproteobacteria bacterium]MDE2495721.1 hypothetical protein [Alphaproteobacteria bacterium]
MSDEHGQAAHVADHNHDAVERIETVSSTSVPWGLRLAFGFGGLLLLAGAFIAWQFHSLLGGTVGQALPWLIAAAVLLGAGAIVESITAEVWVALIAGVFAVVVAFVVTGRVSVYPSQGQSLFVVDRFSGEVELCTAAECKVLPRNGAFLTAPKIQTPSYLHRDRAG